MDEKWLEETIRASRKAVISRFVDVTPELAAALLKRNPENRAVSATVVEKYARDMTEGRWVSNGEPIIVSTDGLLNDGQHRCCAVVASERTIKGLIVFGVDRDSRLTVNQGLVRTASDYLAMNGKENTSALATVASYAWQYRGDRAQLSGQQKQRPTKAEILFVVESFPDMAESVSAISTKGANLLGGVGVLAFCHWCFARHTSKALADEFMTSLMTGSDLAQDSPILYARNRLMAGHRYKANEKAGLIFRAWNAHRKRQTPRTLILSNGPLPALEK